MHDELKTRTLTQFYIGLGLFVLSGGTVMLVTDPFLMADIALVMLSVYLMFTGLVRHKAHG
ncbi:hypothetical protein JCM14076_26550 [Methylosoma difficile]